MLKIVGPAWQRSASGGGPSRFRGVIWHKSNSKWEGRIYDNGKQRFLGYYTSEEEAARVYDEAAARITGRAVNFPNDPQAPALDESLSRANSVSDEPLDQGEPHSFMSCAEQQSLRCLIATVEASSHQQDACNPSFEER